MTFKKRLLAALLVCVASSAALAVDVIDLTTAPKSATVNGATFTNAQVQSTGTGVIDPFLRLQRTGVEQGFNTDANKVLDNKDGIWTHSLTLAEVPIVLLDGGQFYEFMLDINEADTTKKRMLSLDKLAFYRAGLSDATALSQLGDALWSLDSAGADFSITLNYSLNSGSGSGDLFVYIPKAALDSSSAPFLYLYSQFGVLEGSDSGFEEWAVRTPAPTPAIPEPETYALMLAGLAVVGFVARRRKAQGAT